MMEPPHSDRHFLCQRDIITTAVFSAACLPSPSSQAMPLPGLRHPASAALRLRLVLAAAPTMTPCFRHWRRSSLLPLVGEPLAGRAALSWTLEAQYGAKGRALLQRAAASGQCNFVKLPLTAATRAVARSAGEVDSYANPSIPAHWAAASSTLPKSTAAR